MKRELLSPRPEPFEAVKRHPVAGVVGGVVSGLAFGGFGAFVASPTAAIVMTLVGFAIGAPGGAHIAESAAKD